VDNAVAEACAKVVEDNGPYAAGLRKGECRQGLVFGIFRASYDLGHQRANAEREEMLGLLRIARRNIDHHTMLWVKIDTFLARHDQPAGDE